MYESKLAADVCFTVGPPDGPREDIRAHRFVLLARSPVFEAMFCGGWSQQQQQDACDEAMKCSGLDEKLVYCTLHTERTK